MLLARPEAVARGRPPHEERDPVAAGGPGAQVVGGMPVAEAGERLLGIRTARDLRCATDPTQPMVGAALEEEGYRVLTAVDGDSLPLAHAHRPDLGP